MRKKVKPCIIRFFNCPARSRCATRVSCVNNSFFLFHLPAMRGKRYEIKINHAYFFDQHWMHFWSSLYKWNHCKVADLVLFGNSIPFSGALLGENFSNRSRPLERSRSIVSSKTVGESERIPTESRAFISYSFFYFFPAKGWWKCAWSRDYEFVYAHFATLRSKQVVGANYW